MDVYTLKIWRSNSSMLCTHTHTQTHTTLLSHLLSCNVHVPYDDAAVTAAGDELTGVWGVAQTLNFITAWQPHRNPDTWKTLTACVNVTIIYIKSHYQIHSCVVVTTYDHLYYGRVDAAFYGNRKETSIKVFQVNKSNIPPGFLFPYLCPCSSMAVPLRPPMSHMMMEWSELPENRTLWTGSQQSAVTLPGAAETRKTHQHAGGFINTEDVSEAPSSRNY